MSSFHFLRGGHYLCRKKALPKTIVIVPSNIAVTDKEAIKEDDLFS